MQRQIIRSACTAERVIASRLRVIVVLVSETLMASVAVLVMAFPCASRQIASTISVTGISLILAIFRSVPALMPT